MDLGNKRKVLIENLPKDWRDQGAKKFSCGVSKIEKVVYGQRENIEVFEYMVSLAVTEKTRKEEKLRRVNQNLKFVAS